MQSPVITDDIKQSECLQCEGKKCSSINFLLIPLTRAWVRSKYTQLIYKDAFTEYILAPVLS